MQRITRYPLLIKQIIQYTEPDEDRTLTERALRTAEHILGDINEAVREQEGRERLRELSQDLWLGQGYVSTTLSALTLTYSNRAPQEAGPHCANPILG